MAAASASPTAAPATTPADMTLDQLRLALAPDVAAAAAFDGWSMAAVVSAAAMLGVPAATARLAFPGGAMDMIAAWIASVDARMADELTAERLATLPIRQRIAALILFRLGCLAGLEESLRRAQAIMAMPQNAGRTVRLSWRSADVMWRLAGDKSADYNHYTKRATLAAIYTATLLAFVGDASENKAETRAFLDRRIDGVMRFEKAKARVLKPGAEHFSVMRLLGRLRYPAR
jgi:ubiquinone biosynthesis protein COQ9